MHSAVKLFLTCFLFLITGQISAHELTPTYTKLKQSYVENILTTQLTLWNGRADVLYYKIKVFTEDWKEVPFHALPGKTIKLEYTQRQKIDIYIAEKEKNRAVFICTRSQILKGSKQKTVVSSNICSKIK